jgi:hypothetical protein
MCPSVLLIDFYFFLKCTQVKGLWWRMLAFIFPDLAISGPPLAPRAQPSHAFGASTPSQAAMTVTAPSPTSLFGMTCSYINSTFGIDIVTALIQSSQQSTTSSKLFQIRHDQIPQIHVDTEALQALISTTLKAATMVSIPPADEANYDISASPNSMEHLLGEFQKRLELGAMASVAVDPETGKSIELQLKPPEQNLSENQTTELNNAPVESGKNEPVDSTIIPTLSLLEESILPLAQQQQQQHQQEQEDQPQQAVVTQSQRSTLARGQGGRSGAPGKRVPPSVDSGGHHSAGPFGSHGEISLFVHELWDWMAHLVDE